MIDLTKFPCPFIDSCFEEFEVTNKFCENIDYLFCIIYYVRRDMDNNYQDSIDDEEN